jgi:hypothetical protein
MTGPPTGSIVYDAIGPTVPFGVAAVVVGLIALCWIPLRRVLSPPVEVTD